jgi:hypothetical protein
MGQVSNAVMTQLFTQKLDTGEGKTKIAEYGQSYIRDRLREVAFFRQIIPPVNVTKADCDRSEHHDTLVKIVDIEPQSRAMAISFRGQPTARFIDAPRAAIPFFTISSEKFEKTEQEILAYDMPITKIIEDNSVKDIQEIEDREAIIHNEAAVKAIQQEANGGTLPVLNASLIQGATPPVESAIRKGELARNATTDDGVVRPLQRPDIVNLFKLLDTQRHRAERILMTEGDFDDILQWTSEDAHSVVAETMVEGYKYPTLLGRAYVRTIKTDILRSGNLYVYTNPEYLGRFFILNNVKFYIDKIANLITWQSWEDIALGIVNISSVRKVELYSGTSVDNSDSILADVTPVAEEDLGAVNHRVDQGLYYPQVVSY